MSPAGGVHSGEDRIGWPVHRPIPMRDTQLRKAMPKYAATKRTPCSERNNFFMQTDKTIFQQEPLAGLIPSPPQIENIHIRQERQILPRLLPSEAIILMVPTYLTPMIALQEEKESVFALREAVNA
ncbi:hypothetical protein LSUB1_G005520 [Lachnellula subtilissima]|uniref:Uncharacterized protein n=1 Tax=Lachnellula subtilissima TaxID=602034 RepID=A0A8H8RH27_9HELO|nr:hypothetical protein LSUB1_G005520 [Lachnellula subtilissima]